MKVYSILGVFSIFILMLPLFTKAQIPSSPGAPQAVTAAEVRRFIDEYKIRFMRMDLDTFMDLFSKEAVENRMLPYADIREAYKKTIATSQSIMYHVEIYSVQTYTRSAFVSGRYGIIQILKRGSREKVFKSNIQWYLVRENGSLKIQEVNYGRDR